MFGLVVTKAADSVGVHGVTRPAPATGGARDRAEEPTGPCVVSGKATAAECSTPSPTEVSRSSNSANHHNAKGLFGTRESLPYGLPSCALSATLPSPSVVSPAKKKAKKSCPERKKAPDAPRRPLSAYNIFFLVERERLLNEVDQGSFLYDDALVEKAVMANLKGAKTRKKRSHRKSHGKIAFKDLATAVSERWKVLSPDTKALFEKYAVSERSKYKQKMEVWQKQRKKEKVGARSTEAAPSTVVSQSPDSEPSVVSPVVDVESTKAIKIIDPSSPYVPSFAPRDDSLTSMMRRSRAYTALLEQKQAEYELRNSMLDHMHMMINYPHDGLSPDVYESHEYHQYETAPVPSNSFGLATYTTYPEYNEPVDYYDAADATFQLAQRTLPRPHPQCSASTNQLAYPTLPSPHMISVENAPLFSHGSSPFGIQPAQAFKGTVYDLAPAYDDTPPYGAALDPGHPMYDTRCVPHPLHPPQTRPDSFASAVPSVRSLQSRELMAYDLDDDASDDGENEELDVDDESIMGVLNPTADPFSLACVFEA